jgi:large subunit ribosomal protein L9e
MYTLAGHIRNMVKGVTEGFRYKMHTVKKHFPIELYVENGSVIVKRFLGERDVKVIKLFEGVEAKLNDKDKEEIWLEGNDLDKVSLNCIQLT